jgi:hypothetical protein
MTEKVKLAGGPKKTITWMEDGRLKIEFYDFSELAQNMFGNEVAYTLSISKDQTMETSRHAERMFA